MRTLLAAIVAFLPFVAGCLAFGSEQTVAPSGVAIKLSWETLVTIYGPMGGVLVWLIRREDRREKDEKDRRREWTELVKNNTEALTQVKETLTLTRVDDEKQRLATYQLKDAVMKMDGDVHDLGVQIGMSRGNTRVMMKSE